MKFVHIADMHFDAPFRQFSNLNNLGDIRRLEQRKVFKKIIDYIKENQIDYLFIAGDLYEHQSIRKSSIEYINSLFREIPNTKIFISPGNHDPYIKGSYYDTFDWNENVMICKDELEIYSEENLDIYMTAFNDFYMNQSPIEKIKIRRTDKINILLTHCDLNAFRDEKGFDYNPISKNEINCLKFDYVAMGHIHKTNFKENEKIIYPGSTISFGFDELGEHGMVVGEMNNDYLELKFIKLDDRMFIKKEFSVGNIYSKEELVEKLSNLQVESQNMYEIILIGIRNFDINAREILNLVDSVNILKIKDCTELGYDIEEISKENNLRGAFVRNVIKQYETGNYTEEQIKKAIEIGLSAI